MLRRIIFILSCALIFLSPAHASPKKVSTAKAAAVQTVNVNSAAPKTIAKNLKGIGLKKANAIVVYREQFGAFNSLKDLMQVNGINKGIIDKIKGKISFS